MSMTERLVDGSKLATGEVLVFLGRDHLITHFTPASATTRELVGDPEARTAHSGDRFSITVHRGQQLAVLA